MSKHFTGPLTETMFYVLMALMRETMCGIEIGAYVENVTEGRVRIGPGTLYTILAKFSEETWIREVQVSGRKRTYAITELGKEGYLAEVQRLRRCLCDAEEANR